MGIGGLWGIDGNSGGLWKRTAILGEAVEADGRAARNCLCIGLGCL